MKHLAKNIYIKKLDEYNFEIFEKSHPRDKKTGAYKVDNEGNLKVNHNTLAYCSGWEGAWRKIVDKAMEAWINDDVNACREIIDTASKNLKEHFDGLK